ncbi:segregation and condensation protein A [Spiroplasma endosymbiont of Crioceris asparagi]|uniref:segregation and condensation protein A n=1 Tax=Spiroplasma endosymbiont of Crioceris asparagi TaxID=3066286 RepID=UPI0030D19991
MNKWNEVKLNNFTGPLDLLLHLIKEKNMDIMSVDLIEISNQYLDFIKSTINLNIEIASEYLVMAAYLIELKSKLLIPKQVVDIEDNYEENHNELLQKLIEYHKIKESIKYFKETQEETTKLISKTKTSIEIEKIDDLDLPLAKIDFNIDRFAKIFLKLLDKQKLKQPEIKTLTTVEVSPEEIAHSIREYLETKNNELVALEDLIFAQNFTLQMLVATFLAILDLARNGHINIIQENENIFVKNIK